MLSRRLLKRAVYAGGFLLVVGMVGWGLRVLVGPPAEPAPVRTPTPEAVEPIVVEEVAAIKQNRTIDLVARLRNPNVRVGSANYPVTFVLLGSQGQELGRKQETVYLLPGSVHYVVSLGVSVPLSFDRVRVELPARAAFTRLPAAVALPAFSSFLRERSIRLEGSQRLEEQKGEVRNTGTLDWSRVEVAGVALDATGRIVGVGQTFIGELKVQEQREFTLQWPVPPTATQRVVVLPTTNIYREENIVKVIGDPSLLR